MQPITFTVWAYSAMWMMSLLRKYSCESGGDAERIGKVVLAAELTVDIVAVPVVPFVHRDRNKLIRLAAELGLQLAMTGGLLANFVRAAVRRDVR